MTLKALEKPIKDPPPATNGAAQEQIIAGRPAMGKSSVPEAAEYLGNGPSSRNVPLKQIVRSPFNREIDTKSPEFAEMVDSVRQHGVIQPGVGRPLTLDLEAAKRGAPTIELVIGERRWLASSAAGLATMPLVIRQLTDLEAIELQTIENDKRKDLNPIQEAEKYQQLLEQYGKAGMNKEAAIAKLCQRLGQGKSTVYEALRLLELSGPVQLAVKTGALPPSHAGLLAKLPAEFQPSYARGLAPGKALSPKEDEELEQLVGYVEARDEATGLVPFREAKEIIDSALDEIKKAATYEKTAAEFRKKGGIALTLAVSRAAKQGEYVRLEDYLDDFSGFVREAIKGVKELPQMIMRPLRHDPAKAEMVYRTSALLASLSKAGVKPKKQGGGGSMEDYHRRERERQARERIAKAALKASIDPIRSAAGKRNAKIPWPLFIVAMAGWTARQICQRRGWKANYSNAGKVLADHLAKMPENQMPGLVADILIEKITTAHTGRFQPEFVELGKFYGVDVKEITKKESARLAPPPVKKPEKAAKGKVQTSGTRPAKAKKTQKGLTAAARRKLSEAMKTRWAAGRKVAGVKK
jgi:ParB family chromosome partitioning protein